MKKIWGIDWTEEDIAKGNYVDTRTLDELRAMQQTAFSHDHLAELRKHGYECIATGVPNPSEEEVEPGAMIQFTYEGTPGCWWCDGYVFRRGK